MGIIDNLWAVRCTMIDPLWHNMTKQNHKEKWEPLDFLKIISRAECLLLFFLKSLYLDPHPVFSCTIVAAYARMDGIFYNFP